MVENAKNQNKIFENTNISELISLKDGGYIAKTNFGDIIFAK